MGNTESLEPSKGMNHFPGSHGPWLVLNERHSKDIREWKELGRTEQQMLWSQTNLTLTLVGSGTSRNDIS